MGDYSDGVHLCDTSKIYGDVKNDNYPICTGEKLCSPYDADILIISNMDWQVKPGIQACSLPRSKNI